MLAVLQGGMQRGADSMDGHKTKLVKLLECIYHNVSLRAPPKRAERDSDADTAKRDVFPGVNRKNASGSLSAHCIAMHESEWRSVWGLTAFIPSVFDSFSPGS